MDTAPDRILNQLVVVALTIFIVILMLLGALVVRQLWVQQQIAALSNDVQVRLEVLEETTEGIQDELLEIQATPEHAQNAEKWEELTVALDDVDQQLGAIEESIGEVALVLEPEADTTAIPDSEEDEVRANQDQVDQVFTIFAALVAVASIAVAILLGMAVRVQQRASLDGQAVATRNHSLSSFSPSKPGPRSEV